MTRRYPEPERAERIRQKNACLEMRLANGDQKQGAGEEQELSDRRQDDPGNGRTREQDGPGNALIQAINPESA